MKILCRSHLNGSYSNFPSRYQCLAFQKRNISTTLWIYEIPALNQTEYYIRDFHIHIFFNLYHFLCAIVQYVWFHFGTEKKRDNNRSQAILCCAPSFLEWILSIYLSSVNLIYSGCKEFFLLLYERNKNRKFLSVDTFFFFCLLLLRFFLPLFLFEQMSFHLHSCSSPKIYNK